MPTDLMGLQGKYLTAYNAIVQPEKVFSVTRYFLDHWWPILGPAQAWLIIALRQRCFWNDRRDWCIVDSGVLAREAGIGRTTLFKAAGSDDPVAWFFQRTRRRRYDHAMGREVATSNRYTVVLDDPLAVVHQRGLAARLHREIERENADPVNTVRALVRSLSEMSPSEVHRVLSEAAGGDTPTRFEPGPYTVLDVVSWVLGRGWRERAPSLVEECERLQVHITQPGDKFLGTQYFRLHWGPSLGPALASVIIALRSRCYWNRESGELRNTVQLSWAELASAVGLTPRRVQQLTRRPKAALFFTLVSQGKGRVPIFRDIQMRDPLVEADEPRYQAALRQQESGFGIDPETGQLDMGSTLSQEGNFLDSERELSEPRSSGEAKNPNAESEISELKKRNFRTALQALISTTTTALDTKAQQQHTGAGAPDVVVASLLDVFGITGSNRRRILTAGLCPDTVRGWMLYALANELGAGYVVTQLRAKDPPPGEFLALARLPAATWDTFLSAAVDGQEVPPELGDSFASWDRVFGERLREEAGSTGWEVVAAAVRPGAAARAPDVPIPGLDIGSGELWARVLDEVRLQMTKATFDAWVRNAVLLGYENGVFTIGAQNVYARDWLENRLAATVRRTLAGLVGREVVVAFTTTPGERK